MGPQVLLTRQRLTDEWQRKMWKITMVALVGACCWILKGISEVYQVCGCVAVWLCVAVFLCVCVFV